MFLNICKKIYRRVFGYNSYRKSHPVTVYKTWRNTTRGLVCAKYFQSVGLDNVWINYPGKMDRQIMVIQSLHNVMLNKIDGVVAEFGCFKGHTAIQIIQAMEKIGDKSLFYLFDSFQGVPESIHPEDRYWKKGALTAEYDEVKERFVPFGNVRIVKGYFKETLPNYTNLKIKFAHVDADLYVSIKEVNAWLLSRMEKGGVIIYDDYGFETCEGAMKAVDEDLAGQLGFVKWYLSTGQLLAVKIS